MTLNGAEMQDPFSHLPEAPPSPSTAIDLSSSSEASLYRNLSSSLSDILSSPLLPSQNRYTVILPRSVSSEAYVDEIFGQLQSEPSLKGLRFKGFNPSTRVLELLMSSKPHMAMAKLLQMLDKDLASKPIPGFQFLTYVALPRVQFAAAGSAAAESNIPDASIVSFVDNQFASRRTTPIGTLDVAWSELEPKLVQDVHKWLRPRAGELSPRFSFAVSCEPATPSSSFSLSLHLLAQKGLVLSTTPTPGVASRVDSPFASGEHKVESVGHWKWMSLSAVTEITVPKVLLLWDAEKDDGELVTISKTQCRTFYQDVGRHVTALESEKR